MKRFYNILFAVFSVLAVVALFSVADYATAFVAGGTSLGVTVAAKGMLVKLFSDPFLKQSWETRGLREGERKTEFNEGEIGVTFADDGPHMSRRVTAAPILYSDKHRRDGGRMVNIEVKKPLFTDTQDILKTWRYGSQKRIGSEQEAERGNVVTIVDNLFLPIKEKQIKEGLQETANADPVKLLRHLTELVGDNTAKRMDLGVPFSLCAGYDMHHFVNVGLRNGLTNGAKPTADAQAGVWLPPTEHPNMFVWQPNDTMVQVPFNTNQATHSASITAAVDGITSAAKPNLAWLKKINRYAVNSNMIPARIVTNGQTLEYFLLLVSGRTKDLLEEDTKFYDLFVRSYQGIVKANPLLKDTDLMYKHLVIRESKLLDDDYFTMANSFNATGDGASIGDMTYNLQTIGTVEWADIDPGSRVFTAASAAAGSLGAANTSYVGRAFLLGANAVVRCTGTEYKLEPMEITDYGNEMGIGQDKTYGQQRLDQFDNQKNFAKTPQSAEFIIFHGT